MKRIRIPGLLDIAKSDNADEIQALAADKRLDRAFADRTPLLNKLLLQRILNTLQINGRPFPTMQAREAEGRAQGQEALWQRLTAAAPALASGPPELEGLAAFVRGQGTDDACGPLVQQVVGSLFDPGFKASAASWQAAVVLDKALRTFNPFVQAWWAITGRVARSRSLLASMVGGDPAATHAIGIALHNIVNGLLTMRQLYTDASQRASLSPESAGGRCLFAPANVLRQPTEPFASTGTQLSTSTVLILSLQAANAKTPGPDTAFLRSSWSRCPAEQWVPALLAGVWRRAVSIPS